MTKVSSRSNNTSPFLEVSGACRFAYLSVSLHRARAGEGDLLSLSLSLGGIDGARRTTHLEMRESHDPKTHDLRLASALSGRKSASLISSAISSKILNYFGPGRRRCGDAIFAS